MATAPEPERETGPPGGEAGAERRRWTFVPRPTAESRAEERRARNDRLTAALRVGHSLGVQFELSLRSGPEPGLELAVDSPAAERWTTRVLLPSFPSHQWARSSPRARLLAAAPVRWARRRRSWPDPLWRREDGVSWLDLAAGVFATLPRGTQLIVEARGCLPSRPSWWEPILFPGPPLPTVREVTSRARDRPPSGRSSLAYGEAPALRSVFWELGVAIVPVNDRVPEEALDRAADALGSSSCTPGGNGLTFPRRSPILNAGTRRFVVSDEEFAALFPTPDCPAPGRELRPRTDGAARLAIGRTSAGVVVGPILEPSEGRHLAVLGETGMGKSSLLASLARRVGRDQGLLVFDPLGETVSAIAEAFGAATSRPVTRIDPMAFPLEINALEGIGTAAEDPVRSERRLTDLVHAFRRVRASRYDSSDFWGPRIEEVLTRSLRTAAAIEGGTLVDAHTLLATHGRTSREVPTAALGDLRELSERIRQRPDDAEGARRLLYEVVRSPVLRRMLCAERPETAPHELLGPGKIVLLSGHATGVGESTARYLLSVYLALFWSELLARPSPTKTFVLLDEAQLYVHDSLSEMLQFGRRRNVHVVLATQAIASLPIGVREPVWTNVADFVAFRGSPEEAREFARVARGISPDAILSLPRGEAAVLLGKGNSVRWVRTVRGPSGGPPSGPRHPGRTPSDRIPLEEDPAIGPKAGDAPAQGAGEASETNSPGPPPAATSVEDILEWLRAQPPGAAGRLRVALAPLRQALDPGGALVRATGTRLGRVGALVAVERTREGTVWVIDPDRIPCREPPVPARDDPGDSSPPQPS